MMVISWKMHMHQYSYGTDIIDWAVHRVIERTVKCKRRKYNKTICGSEYPRALGNSWIFLFPKCTRFSRNLSNRAMQIDARNYSGQHEIVVNSETQIEIKIYVCINISCYMYSWYFKFRISNIIKMHHHCYFSNQFFHFINAYINLSTRINSFVKF